MNANIELSEKEVVEIIEAHFASKGYEITGEIKLNVGNVCEGYGASEQYVPKFTKATVPIRMKN